MGFVLSTVVALGLMGQTGPFHNCYPPTGGRVTPPGPGYGWGFPNGNPDGYGWVDFGTTLPLGGDRITDYYFRRPFAMPPQQIFMPTYYNPYVMRGQRYVPYTGCGGWHPSGGPPTGSAITPMHPYQEVVNAARQRERVTPVPRFSGRSEAAPVNSGNSGLIP
jgi:hypothetical protein